VQRPAAALKAHASERKSGASPPKDAGGKPRPGPGGGDKEAKEEEEEEEEEEETEQGVAGGAPVDVVCPVPLEGGGVVEGPKGTGLGGADVQPGKGHAGHSEAGHSEAGHSKAGSRVGGQLSRVWEVGPDEGDQGAGIAGGSPVGLVTVFQLALLPSPGDPPGTVGGFGVSGSQKP